MQGQIGDQHGKLLMVPVGVFPPAQEIAVHAVLYALIGEVLDIGIPDRAPFQVQDGQIGEGFFRCHAIALRVRPLAASAVPSPCARAASRPG
ncbi:protein of unknown function [Methylocaldum szegediense]|uniref:Uncharacterized protein n=1 Tax=Methylocaldum szegediense TaxID=73780 RepID=A0ABM9I0F4_9GAMM|nr:protein of unknown function [Methylocaldum szegediense]